ncbi:MAG: exodeoxyribonuclease VII small subunit [Rickettsiales bacterium]|nr:exodeoxyribonuclease VII small subunit [Rickettsiales bacterium]
MTKKSPKNLQDKIAKMDFESAMARLEEIVEILSSEKINLDNMIDLYEEGNALREFCAKRLDEAKMKIEVIGKNIMQN